MEKRNIDIIISVNIYKNKNILINQLKSIKKNVLASYCVILNCNDEMYNIIKNDSFENVYINPEIINKKRGHGSLTQGIVSNMTYAINNFNFKYFVIISGRTIFYNMMNIQKLEKCRSSLDNYKNCFVKDSKLEEYYKKFNKTLHFSAHEGLCFSFIVCNNILNFLKLNADIETHLFNQNMPVEEYALQTIAMNEVNENNLDFGFFYIGNGTNEIYTDFKYTRKILFDGVDKFLNNSSLLYLYKKKK
jgi:hypothetical protein